MTDPLRDLLDELTDGQPHVADWSGRVRRRVAVRRRRQQVVTAAAAVAVLAIATTSAVLASPSDRDALVGPVAGPASPSPVATATAPAPAPEAEPSATAETVPTSQPEPAVEPAASPAGKSAATPAPATTYPLSGTQIIEITAQGRPDRPTVGQEWVLDVTATGTADEPYLQEACFDDTPCSYVATSCVPREADYSPPPPRPGKVQRTFRHTFTTPGRHEVRLEAGSACSYYQGFDKLLIVVQVDEQSPPGSPSPTAAPTPVASAPP